MKKKTEKQRTGILGESLAVDYLISNGYHIEHRNLRIARAEIDIVARKDDLIVFIEVKTRTGSGFGMPEEFVTEKQQKTLIEAADYYAIDNDLSQGIRFDIIAILMAGDNPKLKHFEDAFWPMA